jgi:hypothetical protein
VLGVEVVELRAGGVRGRGERARHEGRYAPCLGIGLFPSHPRARYVCPGNPQTAVNLYRRK